jgi:hypothetical protein
VGKEFTDYKLYSFDCLACAIRPFFLYPKCGRSSALANSKASLSLSSSILMCLALLCLNLSFRIMVLFRPFMTMADNFVLVRCFFKPKVDAIDLFCNCSFVVLGTMMSALVVIGYLPVIPQLMLQLFSDHLQAVLQTCLLLISTVLILFFMPCYSNF